MCAGSVTCAGCNTARLESGLSPLLCALDMGLQSFEHGVERMVEGVFSRSGKSSIRPIELGRRLVREMDDNRSVDVKGRPFACISMLVARRSSSKWMVASAPLYSEVSL